MPITQAPLFQAPPETAKVTQAQRVAMTAPPAGIADVVVDSDAFNEIDDQFAIPYALLHPRLRVTALYAAPFVNHKTQDPAEGMRMSLDEIHRILDLTGIEVPTFAGVESWLDDGPAMSPAAADLIDRAQGYSSENPLYVVALGAPTNIAQALLHAPEIGTRIVVVWLGGEPSTWYRGKCYNCEQDIPATNVVFDGIAPLVHIPASNVTEHLRTSRAELSERLAPTGALGDYLLRLYDDYALRDGCTSKEIWDLGPVAWVAHPEWVRTTYTVSPFLTPSGAWARHPERPLMAEAYTLDVDAILGDMFALLSGK